MNDPFAKIITAVVEGQIRSFIADHPEILTGVNWYKPRSDKASTLTGSIAKRIISDLLCPQTRMRLEAALGATSCAQADFGDPGLSLGISSEVEQSTASEALQGCRDACCADPARSGGVGA